MAYVYITFKIMPNDVDADLKHIEVDAAAKIKTFGGNVTKIEVKPVAFGLNSVNITFSMPESKGSTDSLEQNITKTKGVQSVQVTDISRALG